MCGISGIVGADWRPDRLQAMVDIQAHRGPDASGTYRSPCGLAGLGHNRLSILDLSPAGGQPMSDSSGRYWIAFNGEVYNYVELRRELADYDYRSHTDTEVILAAYVRWGERCVERFIGMFAFAIWDERERRLFCARDRLGIKPFYYVRHDGSLMFVSEIKALFAAGFPKRSNDQMIYDYLARGLYEHTSETFFDGVRSLEPGHTLTFADGEVRIRTYWDLATIVAAAGAPEAPPPVWREELSALLLDAVRLRLRSDVPIGVHLTGGLDSSSLMALLDELMPAGGQMEAFTGVYGDPRYDEAGYSTDVTRSLALHANVCLMDLDRFWLTAEKVQWHQEQPFGGIATMVYWEMERRAREKGVVVLLEGQGGDELFGGYTYYAAEHARDLARMRGAAELDRFVAGYARVHGSEPAKISAMIARMQSAAGSTYQDGSTFLRADCLAPEFAKSSAANGAFPEPSPLAFANARFRDLRFTKLPRVLRFNDRMSMAFGRELRVPFLDHRVVEYSFRLPGETLIAGGLPKWPLRAAVNGRLPDHIRLAPKRAVVTPQREWFRGRFRAGIETRLRNSVLVERGYMARGAMERAFAEFCADESQGNAFFIWQWLNLDLWFRKFQPS